MNNKADIKWFELFFDIIFVVGLSKVLTQVSHELKFLNVVDIFAAFIMILILFNVWIKVVMLENKVKVIEMQIEKTIEDTKYKYPVFIQFAITLYLIHFYSFDLNTWSVSFYFCYLLLTISNMLLFDFRVAKLVIVTVIFMLSFFTIKIAFSLFAVYVIYETIFTFLNLRIISNSIFKKSKIRPNIAASLHNEEVCTLLYKKDQAKLYTPHIIERLGIIMIVFFAEYCLLAMGVMDSLAGNQFVIYSILFISFIILFYYNYFSSLEHIDIKLLAIEDKNKKYQKGVIAIYIIVLYFLSITFFAFYVKNILILDSFSQIVTIGLFGLISFEVADVGLFILFDDFKPGKMVHYLVVKVCMILFVCLFLIQYGDIVFLIGVNGCFIVNIIVGNLYTTVGYRIR